MKGGWCKHDADGARRARRSGPKNTGEKELMGNQFIRSQLGTTGRPTVGMTVEKGKK